MPQMLNTGIFIQFGYNMLLMKNLIVGSAGWRSPYGTNKKIISERSLKSLVNYAYEHNFKAIDTAPAYGDAEELIFECKSKINIDTKLNNFISLNEFHNQLKNLKHNSIQTLYFHDPEVANKFSIEDLNNCQKEIKACGFQLGFSIYETGSLDKTFGKLDSHSMYQVPLNIFDLKFLKLTEERAIPSKHVVFRSLFSRGLIFLNNKQIQQALGKKFPKVKYNFEKFYQVSLSSESMESLTFSLINYISNSGHDILIGFNSIKEIELFLEKVKKSPKDTFDWSNLIKKSQTMSKIEELNL